MLSLRTLAAVAVFVAAHVASGLAGPDVRTRAGMAGRGKSVAKIQGAVAQSDARTASDTLSGMRVRLRDEATRRIHNVTATDANGRFTFENVDPGDYRIEVINGNGAVQVISPKLAVNPGETVGLFLRVGTRVPWFSGFFANTAASAVSSAASMGVTAAVSPEVQSASPER